LGLPFFMDKSNLKIAAIQYNMKWQDVDSNLKTLEETWLKDLEPDTAIVILPEMFSSGFTMDASLAEQMNGKTVLWMKNIAHQKQVAICGSIPIIEEGHLRNRFIWVDPNQAVSFYDKRHLFTFGKEDQYYKRGNANKPITFKGWKILPQICYDLRFPVWSRNVDNYDLMIYIASWPNKRTKAWSQLLIARAIENLCFVCGVNRVGVDGNDLSYDGQSVMIDHEGSILGKLDAEEAILYATLDKTKMITFRNKFGFLEDADNFKMDA